MRRRSVKKRNKLQRRRRIQCESLEDRRMLAPITIAELEPNDLLREAQLINLGTGPGQSPEIDVSGILEPALADTYLLDLQAGDVFSLRFSDGNDVLQTEADISLGLLSPNGQSTTEVRGSTTPDFDQNIDGSPLLTGGDVSFSYVIAETGRYTLELGRLLNSVAEPFGSYTLELRTFRSPLESEPIGTSQILFLDFNGGRIDVSDILGPTGVTGTFRFPTLSQSLENVGYEPTDEDALIDQIVAKVSEDFNDIGIVGPNGNYIQSGTPGEYNIEIRNSRDHADPWGDPNVSRIIVTGADPTGFLFGIAQSVDVGNFDTSETAYVFVEDHFSGGVGNVIGFPLSGTVTTLDAVSSLIANTVSHEAGHFFGGWHTDSANNTPVIMETGGNPAGDLGIGPDGIFGTADDIDVDFGIDVYDPAEGNLGVQNMIASLAFGLATGTQGGTLTGRVFNDANRNGDDFAEQGIAGVTLFADLNDDGLLSPGEPRTTTSTDGSYSIGVAPGTYDLVVQPPENFVATTPTSISVTSTNAGGEGPSFGFAQVNFDVTGIKWNDANGNRLRDAGEQGIEGVHIYLDLDGDNRLDLFEPQTVTAADGSYNINFPGPGTYTIREVVAAGFEQTFPISGEHTVVFDGTRLGDNYNFGNRAALDFGDAPASYGTLAANDGARHGFDPSLFLGTAPSTESDGSPSALADGDTDDGVVLLSPLAPGQSGTIQVTASNSSGNGFLQGWIDLNNNGTFADAGEQFLVNQTLAAGINTLSLPIPAGTTEGNKFVRFRYGIESDLGPTGFSAAGEVEDYVFPIQTTQQLAQDDTFEVARNSTSTVLNVLANDFVNTFDPIRIVLANTASTAGSVIIPADGQSILYTPAFGFLGTDTFDYTVQSASGQTETATVTINVTFQTAVPEAIDDLFNVPQNGSNISLDVLDNDIPSPLGGLQIIDPGTTNNRGIVTTGSGGQSIQYTPAPGFAGTEQFTYTVRDASGFTSEATVTVQLQPTAQLDDEVEFTVRTLDLNGQEIDAINVGDPNNPNDGLFQLQVLVDDIRDSVSIFEQGLGAAYVDLLYQDSLVTTVPSSTPGGRFPFDISFGSLFPVINTADGSLPGLLDDVGGTQNVSQQFHSGPVELFTVTMRAVGAGVATFQTDPLDNDISDLVFLNDTSREVPIELQRFGNTTLNIVPSGLPIPTAIDDVFRVGAATIETQVDVLANDIEGVAGPASIIDVSQPANGFTRRVGNNVFYTPQPTFQGLDQFTYEILSPDGFRSEAEVSVFVGNTAPGDLVDLPFQLVDAGGNLILDAAGNQIRSVAVGDEVALQVNVDDLRPDTFGANTGVFAAYLDILYNAGLVSVLPAGTGQASSLPFNIEFGNFYTNSQVGNAGTAGIINEVGAVQVTNTDGSGQPLGTQIRDLLEIRFRADAAGTAVFSGDPADVSPFQDTLLFQPSQVVPLDQIRYDQVQITISAATPTTPAQSEFHNVANRFDVNNDGNVSPIDALGILNELNQNGPGQLGQTRAEGEQASSRRRLYVDVNNDGSQSPVDALMVINELNRRINGLSAFSEAPVSSSEDDHAADADSVFADLGSSSTLTPATVANSQAPIDWSVIGASESDSDDDDDDDQIADALSFQRR